MFVIGTRSEHKEFNNMLFLSRIWCCLWPAESGRSLFLVGCFCCIRQQFNQVLGSEERQIIRQHIKLSSTAEYLNTSLEAQLQCWSTWAWEPLSLTYAEHFFFVFWCESRILGSGIRKCLWHEGSCKLHLNKLTSSHTNVVSDRTNHRKCSILTTRKITATTATGNNKSNHNSTDTDVRKHKQKIRLPQKERLVNASKGNCQCLLWEW
jgi:hypothetical protein